jgi:predicted transcriptional regulator
MRALLSIKPQYASMIFNGLKRFEYRRTIFAREDVEGVYVYASLPVGGVVGEFRIGRILSGTPTCLWRETGTNAGISHREFAEYFRGAERAYAIEIVDYELYDSPLHLTTAFGVVPPQSFVYIGTPCGRERQRVAKLKWHRVERSKLFHTHMNVQRKATVQIPCP